MKWFTLPVPVTPRLRLRDRFITWLGVGSALGLVGVLLAGTIACGCGGAASSEEIAKATVHSSLSIPLESFRVHTGRYPTSAEGLQALREAPRDLVDRWRGPYLEPANKHALIDPWGQPYRYQSPGVHNPKRYDVWSLGPDKKPSADDIGNW